MKDKYFKKLLLVSALSLTMAYTATSCADHVSPLDTNDMAQAAQTHRLTKESLNEWVQGLQVALPFYHIELKSYEDLDPEHSSATILVSMGSVENADNGIYLETWLKLDMEHGFKSENGIASVARIDYDAETGDASTPWLFNFATVATKLLESFKYESVAVIKPSGEFYSESKSTEPFHLNEDSLNITIPSFTSSMETYAGKRLLRMEADIPLITFQKSSDNLLLVHNVHLRGTDRMVREGVYHFNGKTEFNVEKVEFLENGENLLELNNLRYTENSKVDENGLFQGYYTTQFSGQESIFSKATNNAPATNKFHFELMGQVQNFHAQSYITWYRTYIDNPVGLLNRGKSLVDIIAYGPQLSVEKATLTINGHQGEGSLKVELPPFTASEKEMPLALLMLAKLEVSGDIRVPVEWLELIEPDKNERENAIQKWLENTDHYIELKDNYLALNFSYKDGNLLVNGKDIGLLK